MFNSRFFYASALAGYFALFTLLMLWYTLLSPSSHFPIAVMLIFFVTPLLLPLRGFLHGKKTSCAWIAYLSLFYFIHGIAEAYANPDDRLLAWLEIGSSFFLYLSITLYLRSVARQTG